jgi:hypothetical protein
MNDEYASRVAEFDARNPFSLDEMLATKRTEVAARLDPYYTQTLENYLRGVNLRRSRSMEDERQLLTEINADVEEYAGRQKDVLTEAIDRSAEGLAEVGLLTSGVGQREEGKLRAETGTNLASYLRGAGRQAAKTTLQGARTREDIALEEAQRKTELAREKYATMETQALEESRLAALRREMERNQYIGTPFSSEGASNLASYFQTYI